MSDAPGRFTVRALGNRRYLVTSESGSQRIAHAARGERGMWVFIDGRTMFVADRGAPRPRVASSRDDDDALSAPMPATVVVVNVEPGSVVARGDVLVVLEAMKMELPVKAPRDGRVRAIHCRAGALVQPGSPLVELA